MFGITVKVNNLFTVKEIGDSDSLSFKYRLLPVVVSSCGFLFHKAKEFCVAEEKFFDGVEKLVDC